MERMEGLQQTFTKSKAYQKADPAQGSEVGQVPTAQEPYPGYKGDILMRLIDTPQHEQWPQTTRPLER